MKNIKSCKDKKISEKQLIINILSDIYIKYLFKNEIDVKNI